MKRIACFLMAGTMALLSGCATIEPAPETGGDGVIHQHREFKDLSPQEQEVILHGG